LNIREVINDSPMGGFQMLCIGICVALNMLDGYDVLVMAFTAPSVSVEWALNGKQLGLLLSTGLFGMAGGSLLVAPLADRFGRRAVILLCLILISAGMLLSFGAQDAFQLGAWRVLTGVGIGGMLASLTVITGEYSSNKWRNTAISIQVIGYPLGATIGGSIAAVLIAQYGWRSAFLFGAIASLVMIPIVLWRLPESLDFLLARRPANALQRLNVLLTSMGRQTLTQLPEVPSTERSFAERNQLGALFIPGVLRSTLLVWISFFLVMFAFYFVMSWTPKLLVAAGLSTQQGITGGVLLNVGGIIGGALFGYLSSRINLRKLSAAYLIITAVTLILFGLYASDLNSAFAIAVLIGAFIFGSITGLYAITPALYPAAIRTTGLGWAIGIGRIGAIIAPSIVGVLIDGGWKTADLYYVFAVPLVIAMLTVIVLPQWRSS
jgi:benzoate transport